MYYLVGIPNTLNVVSMIPFFFVGLAGLKKHNVIKVTRVNIDGTISNQHLENNFISKFLYVQYLHILS